MNKKGAGTLVKYTTAILFVFLFSLAIVMYVINFSVDNSSKVDIASNPVLQDINGSIINDSSTFMLEVQTNDNVSKASAIAQGSQATNTGNQFRFSTFKNTIGSIFKGTKTYIFGGDQTFSIILNVIGAFLVFLLIMFIYKAWIGGQPD